MLILAIKTLIKQKNKGCGIKTRRILSGQEISKKKLMRRKEKKHIKNGKKDQN